MCGLRGEVRGLVGCGGASDKLTLVGLAISPVECLELVGPQSRAGAVEASH